MPRPCPVCGSGTASEMHPSPRVVCCVQCGMLYNDADADVDYSGAKYASGFADWNTVRYQQAAERIWELGFDRDATILDIGCATGGLLRELADYGFTKLGGVDPSEACVEQAVGSGLAVKQASLLDIPEKLFAKQDLCILSHVLEHIRDVNKAIAKLRAITDEVYVEVPDASRYADSETSPWQQYNSEHVNHFDLEHLQLAFKAFGFSLRAAGEYDCDPNCFPALWAWFSQKGPLQASAIAYECRSKALWERICSQVQSIQGPVIVWGIGVLARRLEPMLVGKVYAAVDQQFSNDVTFCGKNIWAAEYLRNQSASEPPILVTTVLHKESVLESIHQLGLKNEVLLLGEA